jgi:hypothetical protein
MPTLAQFSGTVYPDKKFSIGRVPPPKVSAEDRRYERAHEQQYDEYINTTHSYEGVKHERHRFFSGYSPEPEPEKSASPLFIKASESSRKKEVKYGAKGITRYGRRFVRNTSLLHERFSGKSRLGFVTCTLPGVSEVVLRTLIEQWSEITRRFYQKMSRQLAKLDVKFQYVGVTEIQEKRFKTSGLPCPHLHFVYISRADSRSRYYLFVCQIHRAWNQALVEGLRKSRDSALALGDGIWGSVHAQRVRKSASAYLGKYISKGCKVLKDMQDAGWEDFPKQWWSADVLSKKMFKNSLIKLDSKTCEGIFYGLEHYLHEGSILEAYFVTINIGGFDYTVGLSGTMSSIFYSCMT